MLHTVLQEISRDYLAASQQPLENHPLAWFIRNDVKQHLQNALGPVGSGLRFKGSHGQGNWTDVPWLAVFDPVVTASAKRGYYAVYLFAADMSSVVLSLNQGTTAVRQEFGLQTRQVLQDRAALMRARLPEYAERFSPTPIALASAKVRPRDYEAGHAFGRVYSVEALPLEEHLVADLRAIVSLYLALTFRGGLDP